MDTPDVDPDLAVDEDAFEAFAEAVTAAVLGAVDGGAAAVDAPAEGDGAGAEISDTDTDPTGSVVYSGDGDSITTLPDGSISFSGSTPGGFGDVDFNTDLGF